MPTHHWASSDADTAPEAETAPAVECGTPTSRLAFPWVSTATAAPARQILRPCSTTPAPHTERMT